MSTADTALAPTNGHHGPTPIPASSMSIVMPSTQDGEQTSQLSGQVVEALALSTKGNDLAALTPAERVVYYHLFCTRAGLDPVYRPFQYLQLQGRLVLYPTKAATEQLTRVHGLTIELTQKEFQGPLYLVTARVTRKDGGAVENMAAVATRNLGDEELANAVMKASTKAIRRTVLSAVGLGMLTEDEAEDLTRQGQARMLKSDEDFDEGWAPAPSSRAPQPRREDDRPRAQGPTQGRQRPQKIDGVHNGKSLFGYLREKEQAGCEGLVNRVGKAVQAKFNRKIRIVDLHGDPFDYAVDVALRLVTSWETDYPVTDDPEGMGHE